MQTAAPILFDVFDKLPKSDWFEAPFDETTKVEICTKSGYRATNIWAEKTAEFIQNSGLKTAPCPYHVLVNVDASENYQINTSCENLANIKQKSWFVLPPLMEFYYKKTNPFYKTLPAYRNDCLAENKSEMKFVYPTEKSTVYLPKNFDGTKNELVLKVAHANKNAVLFWYVNNQFIASTKETHNLALSYKSRLYKISVTDSFGNEITQEINIKS